MSGEDIVVEFSLFCEGKQHEKCIVTRTFVKIVPEESFEELVEIPLLSIFGVHQLSKIHELKWRGSDDIQKNDGGILLTCLDKKLSVVKYILYTKDGAEELRITRILQQLVFSPNPSDVELKDDFKLLQRKDRRMLIVVNPVAGKSAAVKIFKTKIKPILDFAHLIYDLRETLNPADATKFCNEWDFEKYNELGVVGGDGTINECIQGLISHPKINYDQLKHFAISPFPAGSGNALSNAMGSQNKPEMAALIAARGKCTNLDLFSVIHNNKRSYNFLSVTYGMIAQTDIGTEYLRAIGDVRFILGALYYFAVPPAYKAEIKYVEEAGAREPRDTNVTLNVSSCLKSFGGNSVVELGENEEKKYPECPYIEKYFSEDLKKISPNWHEKIVREDKKETEKETILSWVREIKDEVFIFGVINLPFLASDFPGSNFLGLDEGAFDIAVMTKKKINEENIFGRIGMMVKSASEEGLFTDERMTAKRVKAVYFYPKDPVGFVVVDGEGLKKKGVYPHIPMLCEIHPGVCSITHIGLKDKEVKEILK